MTIRTSIANTGRGAVLGVLAVVLTGCSGGSQQLQPSWTGSSDSQASLAADGPVVTCGDWIAFTDDEKSANPLRHDDSIQVAFATDNSLVFDHDAVSAFLADGTVVSGHIDVIDWVCAQVAPDIVINQEDVWEFLLTVGADEGSCDVYLGLPVETKRVWLAAAALAWSAGPTLDEMDAACGDLPYDRFAPAYQNYRDRLADLAIPRVHWTTVSQLGYTFESALEIGSVGDGTSGHPDSSSFHPGDGCSFDPATDAAIPVTLVVTNATVGYDALVTSNFIVRSNAPETVRLMVEGDYSGGPSCEYPDDYTGDVTVGAQYTELIPGGNRGTSSFFIILEDYYSPRYPNGNTGDLARLSIVGTSYYGEDDPVASVTTEEWTLAGVKIS